MPNSPLYREGHTRTATKTTHDYSSCGDASSLFNCHETSYANGNAEIVSDLVTRKVVQTDNVSTNNGNNISDTFGNDSVYTLELNEGAYGSRSRIVGTATSVYKETHKAADILKNDIVAARSGFNDDRNVSSFNSLTNFSSIPSKTLDAFTCIEDDVADGDDEPLPTGGNNLFLGIASDIATELGNYMKKFSKINASTQIEKAKLAAKNEVEKKKKQMELISELPESPSKERLKTAIAEGNLSVLFSNPSNENKEKKDLYDKDEYEAKVAEILPELIEIERHC